MQEKEQEMAIRSCGIKDSLINFLELDGDIGGKKILKENLDSLKIVPVQAGELQDIDRKEDLGTA